MQNKNIHELIIFFDLNFEFLYPKLFSRRNINNLIKSKVIVNYRIRIYKINIMILLIWKAIYPPLLYNLRVIHSFIFIFLYNIYYTSININFKLMRNN